MLCGRYRFSCAFDTAAELPPFKGSTFRGAFGWALKRVVCALKIQQCPACILRDTCAYSRVFESLSNSDARNRLAPPHPFVIEPPATEQTLFGAGEEFSVDLLLFGFANEYLPYFVYAFQEMGRLGLGRRIAGKRSSFQLLAVTTDTDAVYNPADGNFRKSEAQELALRRYQCDSCSDVSKVAVKLETPLRLKFANHLAANLPFHVLVRGMLRRVSVLNEHLGNGEPKLDYRGLIARAEKIETIKSDIRWFDWERYSNRQDRSMLLGGIVGEVVYRGCLGEFMPLLEYCEIVHVGKSTSFGLGKIRVEQ